MFIFSLISWFFFGLIVGAIARLLMPGRQPMGIFKTMLLGVIGSYTGGFLGYMIAGGEPLQYAGWIGSIIGSILLLIAAGYFQKKEIAEG